MPGAVVARGIVVRQGYWRNPRLYGEFIAAAIVAGAIICCRRNSCHPIRSICRWSNNRRSIYRRSNYRRCNSRRGKFRRSNCRRSKFRRSFCRGAIVAFSGAIVAGAIIAGAYVGSPPAWPCAAVSGVEG